ncbi:hypothetical protein EYF80_012983 [Liparis tanakae]|uniref:Uncharacterized protein n=1 Tax=Liparis tanakae TaxID=230148 RepID=A0A4Z2IH17_9TELE|nr:hypothetical protein EYF80_012983 [Liparis tanakae]
MFIHGGLATYETFLYPILYYSQEPPPFSILFQTQEQVRLPSPLQVKDSSEKKSFQVSVSVRLRAQKALRLPLTNPGGQSQEEKRVVGAEHCTDTAADTRPRVCQLAVCTSCGRSLPFSKSTPKPYGSRRLSEED